MKFRWMIDSSVASSSYLQILFSDARVLGLGPRFMSVYIQKLAVSVL